MPFYARKKTTQSAYVARPKTTYIRRKPRAKAPPKKQVESTVKTVFRTLGAIGGAGVGGVLGGSSGMQIGRQLGDRAGQFLSRITGHGDYTMSGHESIKRNTLISNSTAPQFMLNKEGMRLCHREFITDISSTSAFASHVYPINPGQSVTFPWLSQIAENFQEYVVNGLLFEFKSTSAQIYSSTNTSMGVVVMSFNYDASKSPFLTKQSQLNADWAVDIRPDLSVLAPMECARNSNPLNELYVRPDSEDSPANIQFFDMANFQISTVGSQVENVVGELYVTYDITFKKAIQLDDKLGHFAHYRLGSTVTLPSKPFGVDASGWVSAPGSNMDIVFNDSTGTVQLPDYIDKGNFIITYQVFTLNQVGKYAPIIAGFTNCVNLDLYSAGGSAVFNSPVIADPALAGGNLICNYAFTVTQPGASVQISSGSLLNAKFVSGDIIISQVPLNAV